MNPGRRNTGFIQMKVSMNNSENHNLVEMHGCIVCGRLFDILVVYSLQDRLVGFVK